MSPFPIHILRLCGRPVKIPPAEGSHTPKSILLILKKVKFPFVFFIILLYNQYTNI